jgi:hypothetical protein
MPGAETMRALFAILLASSPSTALGKLEVRDVQASYGSLGPERKSNEYVAGDQVFIRYSLAGIRSDADGRTRCELLMIVTDAKGKIHTRYEGVLQQIFALGGDSIPGFATFDLPTDIAPGEYELVMEFKDLISKETTSFRRKIVCKPVEFAPVRVRYYYDAAGEAPARVGGTVRQNLHIRMSAVGFDRSRGEIDVEMRLEVFDVGGKLLLPKPIRSTVHNEKPDVVKETHFVTFSGVVPLHRPGDFVLRITVTDTMTGKKVTFETPLRVSAP